MPQEEIHWLGATELVEAYRARRLSPVEVTRAILDRIARLNPSLNAFCLVDEAAALADARAAEARWRDGVPAGPLDGVPVSIKDLVYTRGWPTLRGSLTSDPAGPWDFDGPAVARLRETGAVLLGKTTTPEIGWRGSTDSPLTGITRNPWRLDVTPGGSSGGAVAAVAAGLGPLAVGTDGGGSIRLPASMCGLVGLKPSRGRISQGPAIGSSWAGATVEGTLTRTVRDSAGFLDVTSTPMPGDPFVAPAPERPFVEEAGAPVERLRIGVATSSEGVGAADPECVAAVESALAQLEAMGHHVDTDAKPPFDDPGFGPSYVTIVAAWVARDIQQWGEWVGEEVPLAALEPHNAVLDQLARGYSATDYVASVQWLEAYTRRVNDWWADGWDLLVTPTVGELAPRLGEFAPEPENPAAALLRCVPLIPFLSPFNVSGQPAISLPLHQSATGLPVGVQLVGAWAREDLLLRVAASLEEAMPWADRTPPVFAG